MSGWEDLGEALEQSAAAGTPARLWLRDDDATRPTAALDRLLRLAADHAVPLVVAIVPAPAQAELGAALSAAPHARAAVHGYVHANHAPAAEKPQELGPHRPHEAILSELADGLARLRRLFAGQALPMLVPPWNRIDPALLPRLPGIGFRSISAFGPAERLPAVPGLTVANADLDLIDWRGTRRCRPHAELVADLLRLLRDRPEPSRPVGVLAHHLVHDEAAWEFLHRLFEASRGLAQWVEPV